MDRWIGRCAPSNSAFTPPAGVDATTKLREVYYRVYIKSPIDWTNPSTSSQLKAYSCQDDLKQQLVASK